MAAAGAVALAQDPEHEARAQFFVSTSSAGADVGDAYRGELFSQQRVVSYAQLVTSTELLRAVARELRLPAGARQLGGKLRASVPLDTVLIDVTATGASAAEAKAIAEAVSRRLPPFIEGLETPPDASRSPVQVSVTRVPELPSAAASPDLRVWLALGLLAGLVLGLGAVAVSAAFDDRIRDAGAIERIAQVPVVGSVKEPDGQGSLVLLDDPLSERAEDYRRIRTQLRTRWRDGEISSLVLSSAGPDDAQESIAANLAIALANGGQRVTLVDGKRGAPGLTARFGLGSALGLSDVLVGNLALDEVVTRIPELPLTMVPAGTPTPDPSDTLASPRMPAVIAELRRHADVALIDAPSLGSSADAAVLASAASGLLLVVRLHTTRAAEIESAARSASGRLIGVVVNQRPARHRVRRAAFGEPAVGDTAPRRTDATDAQAAASPPEMASGRRA